jgi:hypothetical protein
MQNIIIDILWRDVSSVYDGYGVNTPILQAHKRFSSISARCYHHQFIDKTLFFCAHCELVRKELKMKWNRRNKKKW